LTFARLGCRVLDVKVNPLRLVPSVERSDAALCQTFLEGDASAFGELVGRYQDTVYRLMRRYARSGEDARDLTQRAFLSAFEAARRALPAMKDTGAEFPFRPWLLRIAINLAKNHRRDLGRWLRAPVEAVDRQPQAREDAHQALERAQAERLTRRAVLALPRRQREVFTLRIDAGLSFAEVGEVLGIAEGNAKAHFHHAVTRLRAEVQALLVPAERGVR
jgi:RNA polymerase sigma-70 factor (ECF subfamily)